MGISDQDVKDILCRLYGGQAADSCTRQVTEDVREATQTYGLTNRE